MEDKKQSDAKILAFYKAMRDAYNQKYKIRSWAIRKILRHMQMKIHDESTIYYLIQEVAQNRLQNKE